MANFQEKLDSLQPFLIGIRYLEGKPLIDVVLKENWVVTTEQHIKKIKGNQEVNYYMFFSETPEIGVDELLDSVKKTINLNVEHENKQELLKVKFNELKKLFKENNLDRLKQLKFVFNTFDEDYLNITEEPLNTPDNTTNDINDIIAPPINNIDGVSNEIEEEIIVHEAQYLDENGNPLQLSEEELEMIEEEKRAEVNRKILKNKKTT
jgi:hypothetical protein